MVTLEPIAILKSPFKEKFGIPRQPGIIPRIKGVIEFTPKFSDPAWVKDLDKFSHLWIIFLFDQNSGQSPTVRPPRLGGNKRVGVFASRSPHRPNSLGMSVVKLDKVEQSSPPKIFISGHDLMNGTQIVDIKPYIPRWDYVEEAKEGWVSEFEQMTQLKVDRDEKIDCPQRILDEVIEIIAHDPRPVHQYRDQDFSTKTYSMKYDSFDVHWKMIDHETAYIFQIDKL